MSTTTYKLVVRGSVLNGNYPLDETFDSYDDAEKKCGEVWNETPGHGANTATITRSSQEDGSGQTDTVSEWFKGATWSEFELLSTTDFNDAITGVKAVHVDNDEKSAENMISLAKRIPRTAVVSKRPNGGEVQITYDNGRWTIGDR